MNRWWWKRERETGVYVEQERFRIVGAEGFFLAGLGFDGGWKRGRLENSIFPMDVLIKRARLLFSFNKNWSTPLAFVPSWGRQQAGNGCLHAETEQSPLNRIELIQELNGDA